MRRSSATKKPLIPARGTRWKRGREAWTILEVNKYECGVSVSVTQGSGSFKRWLSMGLEDFHSEFKPIAKQKK